MTKPLSPAVAAGPSGILPAAPALATGHAPVTAARRPSAPTDSAGMWKVAQDFEAMAIGEFLQPMFDTIDTAHTLFGGGDAEDTLKPMLIQAMGKQIAAHGGLGLAQPVYDAMLRMQEAHAQGGSPS